MLLLLHGAMGAASSFDTLIPLLRSAGDVIPVNFSGHGGEPLKSSFSLDLFVKNIEEKILTEEKLFIFGYSMGGYVALSLAARRPALVSGIVTLNTKLDWTPETAAFLQSTLNPEKIEAKAPALAAQMAQMHAPADWKALAAATRDFMGDLGRGKGLRDPDFQSIDCPVTLLRGDKDPVVTEAETRRVAGLIPRGNYGEVPSRGHALEQADMPALAAAIVQHLAI